MSEFSVWKQHTSLSLSADGIDAFDTQTIVAALPSGVFNNSVRRPNDSINFTARLEHMLSKSQMRGMDGVGKRYAVELYAQAYNVLNHVNAQNFSGVVGSPFFGQATSAAAPRRVELGARLNF